MIQLNQHDLQWALTRLPAAVITALKANADRVFLAGGFIRAVVANEEVNDFDLFVPNFECASSLAMQLAEGDPKRIYKTDNAYTIRGYKLPVQIIFRWTYESPLTCIESFDFTIAMAALYWSAEGAGKWVGMAHDSFYADLAAKRLIYTSPMHNEDAGGSLLRVLKFYQRGYRIPLGSLGAVMSRLLRGVHRVNWEKRETMTPDEWEAQMGHVLTGLLREVDPAHDPEHLAHLPDVKPESTNGGAEP